MVVGGAQAALGGGGLKAQTVRLERDTSSSPFTLVGTLTSALKTDSRTNPIGVPSLETRVYNEFNMSACALGSLSG